MAAGIGETSDDPPAGLTKAPSASSDESDLYGPEADLISPRSDDAETADDGCSPPAMLEEALVAMVHGEHAPTLAGWTFEPLFTGPTSAALQMRNLLGEMCVPDVPLDALGLGRHDWFSIVLSFDVRFGWIISDAYASEAGGVDVLRSESLAGVGAVVWSAGSEGPAQQSNLQRALQALSELAGSWVTAAATDDEVGPLEPDAQEAAVGQRTGLGDDVAGGAAAVLATGTASGGPGHEGIVADGAMAELGRQLGAACSGGAAVPRYPHHRVPVPWVADILKSLPPSGGADSIAARAVRDASSLLGQAAGSCLLCGFPHPRAAGIAATVPLVCKPGRGDSVCAFRAATFAGPMLLAEELRRSPATVALSLSLAAAAAKNARGSVWALVPTRTAGHDDDATDALTAAEPVHRAASALRSTISPVAAIAALASPDVLRSCLGVLHPLCPPLLAWSATSLGGCLLRPVIISHLPATLASTLAGLGEYALFAVALGGEGGTLAAARAAAVAARAAASGSESSRVAAAMAEEAMAVARAAAVTGSAAPTGWKLPALGASPEVTDIAHVGAGEPALSGSAEYLWHGTGVDNLAAILRTGLRSVSGSRFMTSGAAHGQGVYLARSASLSLTYAKPPSDWLDCAGPWKAPPCGALLLVRRDTSGSRPATPAAARRLGGAASSGIVVEPDDSRLRVLLVILLGSKRGAKTAAESAVSQKDGEAVERLLGLRGS